jgi:hypothetical protein
MWFINNNRFRMDGGVRETIVCILKRVMVLLISNISAEIVFPYIDSMLNILRFGEPSLDYEMVVELFIIYFIHFVYVSRLFGLEFEHHHFTLHYFGSGIIKYIYYAYARTYIKNVQSAAWQIATDFWQYCTSIERQTVGMICALMAALAVLVLLRLDRKRTARGRSAETSGAKATPS